MMHQSVKKIQALLFVLLCLSRVSLLAQTPVMDTVQREVVIQFDQRDNAVQFTPITPPLQQIQGAPQAFYTFHWEFGDGHYSTSPSPSHTYNKPGEHTVRLWTTNNYDNGKPPPARPKKMAVKKIVQAEDTKAAQPVREVLPDAFQLKNNRAPVPDEEMVVVMSYENPEGKITNGRLYMFYNERKYKASNFELLEVRTHHGEREITNTPLRGFAFHGRVDPRGVLASVGHYLADTFSVMNGPMILLDKEVEEARTLYKDVKVFEFNDMPAYQTRNAFFSFRTTPGMLKDTNALITIRGIYVPERGVDKHKSKSLEMEIVTSHDPNKMSVSDARLNYRFYRNKDLTFKVRFQNNGEGPARTIKLLVDVPEAYNPYSLQVKDNYPPCPICPKQPVAYSCLDTVHTNGQLTFQFKNIYLPGSRQDNVNDYDSTKGFVRYTLRYHDKVEKEASPSRTSIIFDNNEPVITNTIATRFKPGLSIGVKLGTGRYPTRTSSENYLAGVVISPYRSAHGYWQSELQLGTLRYTDSLFSEVLTPFQQGVPDVFNLAETAQRNRYVAWLIYAVPASYRYSFTKWLGVGAGVQLAMNLRETLETDTRTENFIYSQRQNFKEPIPDLNTSGTGTSTDRFDKVSASLFTDVVIGSARIGPAVGIRYL